jgi:NDP-sugar pyrophosphorylase family protein
MKAILLAGGQGTRLRPLTLNTPKPVVPIFGRPFLHYQIDRILQVPEIDEIVLSLNYQPERIEAVFGDGSALGTRIRYVVEPTPLGTAGGIKFASHGVQDTIVVFNGDVLTEIDLAAVIARHRARRATATIVLSPVENTAAYGLVETDPEANILRFVEKPDPAQITTDRINAGIYVLEPSTFDRIPDGEAVSIERQYFPSLVARRETFVAYMYDGYWIDIGTPAKYAQVHRDILEGRFHAVPFTGPSASRTSVAVDTKVGAESVIEGPVFVDAGVTIENGARVGPRAVIGRGCRLGAGAVVEDSILWADCEVGPGANLRGVVLGTGCRIGRSVTVDAGTVLADHTHLPFPTS